MGPGTRADRGGEDALAPHERAAFDAERAGPIRVRAVFVAVVSALIWLDQYAFYESEIFATRWHSSLYRGVQAVTCLSLVAYLRRPRSGVATERAATAAYLSFAVSAAFAVLVVDESCVMPFTLTAEWGMMVIALASMLSFRPALLLLTTTWIGGALANSARSHWTADLSDHFILAGVYAVVLAHVRSVDGLRTRELAARMRLAVANDELLRAEEVRGRLFVNLSHDLRTPLALIHAEADLLAREPPAEARASALERMRAHVRAMADLTNQLLELSRLEAGKTPVSPRDVDLRAAAEAVARELGGADARVRVVAGDGAIAGAHVDPGHLRRILANLVANGLRQVERVGGEVRVRVARDGDDAVVLVEDDGAGIDPSRRDAIFERFASFDATGSVASGIGLPIARELAELNQGALDLVDGAACTTFRLALPSASGPVDPVAVAGPPPAAPAPSPPPASADASLRSVLLVEDHAEMRALLASLLAPRFSVRVAADVASARAELAETRPDAVLCDVLLPDGDGFAVLDHVRSKAHLEGVPFLFLSALGEAEQRARGIEAGADDYLAKPFAADEVIARLSKACERAESRARALAAQRLDLVAELHDGVAASLSHASMLLSAAEQEPDAELVSRARASLAEAMGEVRGLMAVRDDGSATWESVAGTLDDDVDALATTLGVDATLEASADGSARFVTAAEQHTLRRLVREAITNAAKHAAPRSIRCRATLASGRVEVRVEDDGQGTGSEGTGRGLAIARRRVERLGGEVSFRREGASGVFRAAFPLGHAGGSGSAHEA